MTQTQKSLPLTPEGDTALTEIINRLTDGLELSQQIAIVSRLINIYRIHLNLVES